MDKAIFVYFIREISKHNDEAHEVASEMLHACTKLRNLVLRAKHEDVKYVDISTIEALHETLLPRIAELKRIQTYAYETERKFNHEKLKDADYKGAQST